MYDCIMYDCIMYDCIMYDYMIVKQQCVVFYLFSLPYFIHNCYIYVSNVSIHTRNKFYHCLSTF